jgi:preprotein translocase subunit SecA
LKFLNEKYLNRLLTIQLHRDENVDQILAEKQQKHMHETNQDPALDLAPQLRNDPRVTIRTHVKEEDRDPRDPATWGKVGRNDPCPCGSGKKYKQCHGSIA